MVWSYLPCWSPDMAAPPGQLRAHIYDLSVYVRRRDADRGGGAAPGRKAGWAESRPGRHAEERDGRGCYRVRHAQATPPTVFLRRRA
ncbi:hypothetical protein GCM10010269_37510 [Streptomyces humidus]|uniref:Uncharacterized protein n=1 Tax=Streptomyces humidus TaxID=52259 RepID=A0A918L4D8_9ACTN|nr:hypothetical protein GCM10010269_37510 [Streptomyces humidus]